MKGHGLLASPWEAIMRPVPAIRHAMNWTELNMHEVPASVRNRMDWTEFGIHEVPASVRCPMNWTEMHASVRYPMSWTKLDLL